MKRRNILLFAAAGIAAISVGGNILEILGVASIFIAVWATIENGRIADWDHDIRKAYPDLMAQPRKAARKFNHTKPQLANVLS